MSRGSLGSFLPGGGVCLGGMGVGGNYVYALRASGLGLISSMRLDGRKNFQSVKLLRQISYSELLPTNCLSVFDYFVGLVIKLLKTVF